MDYEYLTELNEFLDDYVHELSEAHDEDHWHKVENLIGALAIVSVSLRRKLKLSEKTEVAKPVVEKVGRTGFTVNGNPIIDLWDEDEAKGATSLMNALRHWGVIAN